MVHLITMIAHFLLSTWTQFIYVLLQFDRLYSDRKSTRLFKIAKLAEIGFIGFALANSLSNTEACFAYWNVSVL